MSHKHFTELPATTHPNAVICAAPRESADPAPKCGKDILSPSRTIPLPATKRCPKCGLDFPRSSVSKTQCYCAPCRAADSRARAKIKASEYERKRLLLQINDLTRPETVRRDALTIVEEMVRIYHGPAALAARLQELDADLRARGDLANQVRLFEAVLTVLSRASVAD